MKIEIRAFSGTAPRFSPELLGDQNGQQAVNISIKSGKIHPEKKFSIKYPDRDYVPGQINDDQYNRLYFIDGDGTLKVAGMFGTTSTYTEREVDIPIPGKPEIISVSSPFLENFANFKLRPVTANKGSASWRAEKGIATHIYSEITLSPVDEWKEGSNGKLERTYAYNPWETYIYYPKDKSGDNSSLQNSFTTKYLTKDSVWDCPCTMVIDGKNDIVFSSRNAALTSADTANVGKLLTYSGKQVGSFCAYNEKVPAAEYPAMTVPSGAVIKSGKCYYLNGRGTISTTSDKVILNQKEDHKIETVTAGNLHLVLERNYTSVDRDTFYVVRAVNDIGEEGAPSELSELLTCRPDEAPTITFTPPADVPAGCSIAKYRLYRAAGGTSGSDFFFVSDIDADTVEDGKITFEDTLSNEELGEALPKYGRVPEKLSGICGMSGGFIAAYKGKDIYFSEPFMPYCFPWEYRQSVPFNIVGMAVRSNYLYVMTEGPLYAFVGDAPETIVPLSFRFDVPCISRRSIAHVQGNIIYAGTTGLVLISNEGPSVFSDKLYTLEQYKALNFEYCICSGEYDGKYFAVFDDKVLLFDFSDGQLNHTTLSPDAFSVSQYVWNATKDPESGSTVVGSVNYIAESWAKYRDNFNLHNTPYGETIITQDFDSSPVKSYWQSKEFVFPRPMAFSCARVNFEDPDAEVHIKLFANRIMVYDSSASQNAPNGIPWGKAFRLPVLRRETKWSVEVSGATDITSVELAESMTEM